MKTKNNNQKTISYQVKNAILRSSIVIGSLVLITWTVNAQEFWKQFLDNNAYGKMAIQMMSEQPSESGQADAVVETIRTELADQAKSSSDVSASETARNPEMESGAAKDMEDFLNSAEAFSACEADQQVAKFADKQIQLQENDRITEAFISAAELSDALVADHQVAKFANKQIQLQENARANEAFISAAELRSALEADRQVAKYADKQIQLQENACANEAFVSSAELSTAMEAELQVEKYAQKQITHSQNSTEK